MLNSNRQLGVFLVASIATLLTTASYDSPPWWLKGCAVGLAVWGVHALYVGAKR